MELPNPTTFGLLQSDERYKNVKRALKSVINRRSEIKSSNSLCINGDQPDTSEDVSQCSHLGSEVMASSSNMKNLLSHRLKTSSSQNPTSSSNIDKNAIEKALMPPPKTTTALVHSSSRSSLASSNTTFSPRPVDSGIGRSFKMSSPMLSSIKSSPSPQNTRLNAQQGVTDRIFRKWRVMLNAQGQLYIRGTLQCGKVVRSKPVTRRHSVVCVESIFNHLYHLEGEIYDDKHELPDYIRGKFFNGFPDDWENACQLWRNYVAAGCKDNFRWPMPIADSDDDLVSEITDLSVGFRLDQHSQSRDDTITTRSTSIKSSIGRRLPDSESISKIPSVKKELTNVTPKTLDQPSSSSGVLYNSVGTQKDISPEDLTNIVLDTLMKKNCPAEYADQLIYAINCYKYLTNRLKNDNEQSKAVPTMPGSHVNLSQENSDDLEPKIETPVPREIDREDTISQTTYTLRSGTKSRERTSRRCSQVKLATSELSESDCAPRRSVRRVLRTREEHSARHRQFLRENLLTEQLESRRRCLNYDSDDDKAVEKQKISPPKVQMPPPARPSTSQRSEIHSPAFEYRPQSSAYQLDQKSKPSRDVRRESSVSTITGFLATHDSSMSITEDEQNSQLRPILRQSGSSLSNRENNRNFYESCESLTEGYESRGNLARKDDQQRRILQEANARCFQQLRRPLIINRMKANVDKIPPKMHANAGNMSEQPREQKKIFTEHQSACHDKENALNELINDKNSIKMHGKCPESSANENKKVEATQSKIMPRPVGKPVATSIEIVNIPLPLGKKKFIESRTKFIEPAVEEELPKEELKSSESVDDSKKISSTSVKERRSQKSPAKVEKIENGAVFGSENNPKKLTSWIPRVLATSEPSLVFEGKLLNAVDHVLNRKFTTDTILRRVKPTIVETVSHEFYQLVGEMCDPKHVVPRELHKQCFKKCPDRIDSFCKKWIELEAQNSTVNSTVATESVMMSSRGRRILRPLSYWEGERVATVGNQSRYIVGTPVGSVSPTENTGKRRDRRSITSTSSSMAVRDTSSRENPAKESLEDKQSSGKTKNRRQSQRSSVKRRLEKEYDTSSDTESPRTATKRRKNAAEHDADEETSKKQINSNERNTQNSGIVAKYVTTSLKKDFTSESD